MRRLTHLTVAAIAGCLATSVPVLGEELEIPHTRVATAGMSGGVQCTNGVTITNNGSDRPVLELTWKVSDATATPTGSSCA